MVEKIPLQIGNIPDIIRSMPKQVISLANDDKQSAVALSTPPIRITDLSPYLCAVNVINGAVKHCKDYIFRHLKLY